MPVIMGLAGLAVLLWELCRWVTRRYLHPRSSDADDHSEPSSPHKKWAERQANYGKTKRSPSGRHLEEAEQVGVEDDGKEVGAPAKEGEGYGESGRGEKGEARGGKEGGGRT